MMILNVINNHFVTSDNIADLLQMLHGLYLDELRSSTLARTGLINTIKSKLVKRKERERIESQRAERQEIADKFKRQINDIQADFEKRKLLLQGMCVYHI